ncbi:hypothetical protein [Sulfobacillus sp. hq2]|uniref:hypothetical protein n=1 Tax=Sulfobacillus sp. hq2 TaxID=2039167 RepID=UPI000CD24AE2|nr:hypothetical protein [Sulfobacillus sp. hq2]POB10128.1 hypothetical protein CO251_11630 [Sulfobacillus sp. hq2]
MLAPCQATPNPEGGAHHELCRPPRYECRAVEPDPLDHRPLRSPALVRLTWASAPPSAPALSPNPAAALMTRIPSPRQIPALINTWWASHITAHLPQPDALARWMTRRRI